MNNNEVNFNVPYREDQHSNLVVSKILFRRDHEPASPSSHTSHRRLFNFSLSFMLVEYIIYFIFQLVSWFLLGNFWAASRWYTGLILLLVYIAICAATVFLQVRLPLWSRFILKFLEFMTCLFLLGWAAGFGEFAAISLSYMTIVNILLVLSIVKLCKRLSIAATVIMLIFICADMIAISLTISLWYYAMLAGLWQALRTFSLHYTGKLILADPFNIRKTLEFTLKLWYQLFILRVEVGYPHKSFTN